MAVNPTYPGVYVEELPSSVRTITGVATSIAAFIGRTSRGPDNKAISITSYADFERSFGGLYADSTLGYAVRDFYLNGGSQAIIVRLHKDATYAKLDVPGLTDDTKLSLIAASVGSWGNKLSVAVDHATKDPDNPHLFNLTVFENKILAEKFLNVSLTQNDPRYLPRVLEQSSNLVRVAKATDGKGWAMPAGLPADQKPPQKPIEATLDSGSDGVVLTIDQFTANSAQEKKQGLYALEQADLFNILCIPPYDDSKNEIYTRLIGPAADYCLRRRAILLIDPPNSWQSAADCATGVANIGTNSKNAALFFPRLMEADPLRDNQIAEFAPCGAVAGIFARTDTQRGVWKAPAGQDATLVGVPQLRVPLTDLENGLLNPLGINCMRTLPAIGRVVWGARTLQGNDRLASEWKYIPVRRTALYIEESLYRGTQWVVFEPNDEPLWAQIRLNVGAFMQNLFRKGAFQGSTPREAYLVKCDRETTTQNDINLGIVNILVGFAPLKPAEFVMIQIQQLAGQIAA